MPRPRKYVRDAKNKTVDGVSYHERGGFYIILPNGQRQYFGKAPAALHEARKRYETLFNPQPRLVPAMTREAALQELINQTEGLVGENAPVPSEQTITAWINATTPEKRRDVVLGLGVPAKYLADNPSAIAKGNQGSVVVDPEWAQNQPGKVNQVLAQEILGISSNMAEKLLNPPPSTNPGGQNITVSQVGAIYRNWYVESKHGIDVEALKSQAETIRSKQRDELAAQKGKLQQNASMKRGAHIKALERRVKKFSWVDLLPRRPKAGYRDAGKYFGEFAGFIKARYDEDIPVHHITGDDFRAYYEHVAKTAKKKKTLTSPEKWKNHRYKTVTTAFRRVKKIYPDAAYPIGMFGVDGTLAILECNGTSTEGAKTLITPSELKSLLEVADKQWRAILRLSLNAALANTDIAEIRWDHIDFQRKLMVFPRPKTGRTRQTPLAEPTIDALNKWKEESQAKGPNVFYTWHGDKWVDGTDSVGKHFDLLKAEVEKKTHVKIPATFKSLRKTAASCVMQRIGNEVAVDMLLGHAPRKSWRHYVGFAPDFLHQAVKAIAKEFF